jgi:hypothetical protein
MRAQSIENVGRSSGMSVTRRAAFAVTCLALFGVFGGACSRKSAPKPAPAASAEEAEEKVAAQVPSDPVEAAIFQVVEHCSFNEEHAVISKCENNEKQSAIRDFNTGKLSRTEAFPKLVEALASSDKKRSVVASKLFESAFRNSFGTSKTDEVNKGAATRLLGLLQTLPERQVTQVAPAAVHAAMLTGQQAELYKALDEHPNKDLRASAYVYLLRYGTLKELPKIQSLVQGPDERVAASAVEALRRMPGQSPEDIKQICEFVKPLAQDARPAVAGKAMAQLVACGGEYLDTALTATQQQQKAGALNAAVVRGFDQTCVAHRGQTQGTKGQCTRLRSVLEQVLADTKLEPDARQFALLGLGLQFPDGATLKIAEKYLTAEDKRVKSAAERVVRSVGAKLKGGPQGANQVNPKSLPHGTAPYVVPPRAKVAAPAGQAAPAGPQAPKAP